MLIIIRKCKNKINANSDIHYYVSFLTFPNKPSVFGSMPPSRGGGWG